MIGEDRPWVVVVEYYPGEDEAISIAVHHNEVESFIPCGDRPSAFKVVHRAATFEAACAFQEEYILNQTEWSQK